MLAKRTNFRKTVHIYLIQSVHFDIVIYIRELIKKKVPIDIIKKQYSHVSIEMTVHYLTLQETELKDIYSEILFDLNNKEGDIQAEMKDIFNNLFYGKTETEIETVLSNLSKNMSFNLLPTGLCLYDFRRGSCSSCKSCFELNCPNFIPNVDYYPVLKKELEWFKEELFRLENVGCEEELEKQHITYTYLETLLYNLEMKIDV